MSHDDSTSSFAQRQARRAQIAPGAQVGIDEAMVHRVVHGFYDRIRADAMLGPIFNGAIQDNWDHHLAKMCDFWSSVLLMTGRYEGRPMPAHLRLDSNLGQQAMPRLDQPHFDHWLTLFRATVAELCPPAAAALFVDRAEKIATSFVMGIRFHRGQEPDWLGPARSAPVKPD